MTTIFAKIVRGEIPADKIYQDDRVTAFKDIQPVAPVHVLIVPNQVIPTTNDLSAENAELVGHMVLVAAKIADEQGIADQGYRLVMNCNEHGGQEVFHLHLHLLGGRALGAMVGSAS